MGEGKLAYLLCNGILSGLVSVSGCCYNVEMYYAFVIGIAGGLLQNLIQKGLFGLNIYDPVNSISIFLWGGMWSSISTGLFLREPIQNENVQEGAVYVNTIKLIVIIF